jgi:hypothetical protein
LLVVSMGCLLALAVDAIPGVDIGLVAWLWQRMQGVTLGTVAVTLVCVSVIGLALGNAFSPEALLTTRKSVMARWRNLYASNDPVSGGSLFARFRAEMRERKLPIPRERQIFNTRFALFDHTGYWKNVEQFVAPIALDLLGLMGQGFDRSLEASALEGAAHRRDLMTWWMQMVCLAGGLASAGLAYGVAFGSPARAAAWWTRGGDLWQRGTGFFDSLRLLWSGGFVGQVISDLATPLAILLGVLVLTGVRAMLGSHSSRRLVDDLAGR